MTIKSSAGARDRSAAQTLKSFGPWLVAGRRVRCSLWSPLPARRRGPSISWRWPFAPHPNLQGFLGIDGPTRHARHLAGPKQGPIIRAGCGPGSEFACDGVLASPSPPRDDPRFTPLLFGDALGGFTEDRRASPLLIGDASTPLKTASHAFQVIPLDHRPRRCRWLVASTILNDEAPRPQRFNLGLIFPNVVTI